MTRKILLLLEQIDSIDGQLQFTLTLHTRVSAVHQITVSWLSLLSSENSLLQKIVYDVITHIFDDVIDIFDDVIADVFDDVIDEFNDVTDFKTADLSKEW